MTRLVIVLPLLVLASCNSNAGDKSNNAADSNVSTSNSVQSAGPPQSAGLQLKARDVLKGQWISQSDSCTPPGGRAESPPLNFYSDRYDEQTVEGFSLFEHSCTFPKTGVISQSSYAGKMSCGYGEGWEGDANVKISVSETGVLLIKQEPSRSSDGSDEREETGWSGTFKRCPKVLNDPETY